MFFGQRFKESAFPQKVIIVVILLYTCKSRVIQINGRKFVSDSDIFFLQNLFELYIVDATFLPQNISNEHIVGLSNTIA